MGKGKRNRQFHFEDKQVNPEKYKEQKKPFRMPKWATYTIWSALLIIVVAAIVLNSLTNNGVFLRNRVLLNSQKDSRFDLNQQMVTFIVWQNMYQSAYTEFLYTQYGLYEDTHKIVDTYRSPDAYGLAMANYYTTQMLRDGVDAVADYLEELVAGADAAVALGLELNEVDKASIEEVVDFVKSLQTKFEPTADFDNFISFYVGQGVNEKDVRKAATLMAMYTKYCDYTKFSNDYESMKDKNNKDVLLDFIARNPSAQYQATYRMYQLTIANGNDADIKAFAEKLSGAKTEAEFTSMIVDRIMEITFTSTALTKYTLPRAEADQKLILEALKNKGDASNKNDDLNAAHAKAEELGLTETTYTKVVAKGKTTYSPELSDSIAKWMFASARTAGNVTVLTVDESIYLVYIYEAAKSTEGTDSTTTTVKAGMKEFKLADDEEKFASFKETLVKDLNSEDRKNTTDHKSAEDLAKVLYDELKKLVDDKDDKTVPTLPKDAKTETIAKPDENVTPTALQKYLFDDANKVEIGKIYQIDDNGTSYVLLVDGYSEEKKEYIVTYSTFEDSDYYHFFRALSSQMNNTYPSTAPTLKHPEATTEDSFEEWMCEADVTEKTATEITKRTFKRLANEVKSFPIYKTNNKGKYVNAAGAVVEKKEDAAITGYKVYFVVEPMKLIQSEEATVYGGYLKYDTEAEAKAALEKLAGLKGYGLWQAFGALTTTNVTKDSNGKETSKTATATVETDIKKSALSDEALKNWMFDKARVMNEVAVVPAKDGKAFYLAYFKSTELEWTRIARDKWIAADMTEKLEALVKDGGYKLDESILDKIGEPTPKTETTTAAESTKEPEGTTAAK